VSTTEPIRPLRDVWLRPRRVFRELASRPVGITDYLLAAAQGIATWITVYRTQLTGVHAGASEILASSFLFGPMAGIFSLYLFAAIYLRLCARAGGTAARNQVIHVLAYGGLPMAASLILWVFTALFVGDAAIVPTPKAGADLDSFVAIVLRAQSLVFTLLALWSVVLQVMGLSEIQGFAVRKSFAVWLLGQVLAFLAAIFLTVLFAILFPGLVPSAPH
jgi:Yip1 domain